MPNGRLAFSAVFAAFLTVTAEAAAETVTLTVTVRPFLSIEPLPHADDVENESGPMAPEGVSFRVAANVPYAMEMRFSSLQADPAGPHLAAFSNGRDMVGGLLSLHAPLNALAGNSTPLHAPGRMIVTRGPGTADWHLAATLDPRATDAPGGLAPPGDYSLDVQITLVPR